MKSFSCFLSGCALLVTCIAPVSFAVEKTNLIQCCCHSTCAKNDASCQTQKCTKTHQAQCMKKGCSVQSQDVSEKKEDKATTVSDQSESQKNQSPVSGIDGEIK